MAIDGDNVRWIELFTRRCNSSLFKWWCLAMIALGAGCGGSAITQTAVRPQIADAPPHQARVVFLRASREGQTGDKHPVTVWDTGAPLGYLHGGEAFVADLTPGKRHFVATADNTDVVAAELVAGKVYYINLWYTPVGSSGMVQINPIRPGSAQWGDKERWIERSTFVELILEQVPSWSNLHVDEVRQAMADYQSQEAGAKRKILPEFGE